MSREPTRMPGPDGAASAAPDRETVLAGLAAYAFARAEALPGGHVFGLIDAACDPLSAVTLEAFPEPARCLIGGSLGEELAGVAPWLVRFDRHGPAWDWFASEAWGRNRGVLVVSNLDLARLKARLKKPLRVEDEDGKRYFFKYYRPNHLNAYLPAMDEPQRRTMFSGVACYLAEAPGTGAHLLAHVPDRAEPERVALEPLGAGLVVRPPDAQALATETTEKV